MTAETNQFDSLVQALKSFTPSQIDLVSALANQFQQAHTFHRNESSDIVTPKVLEMMGDILRIHHAMSRQALSKDRFEFALERALNSAGIPAELVANRTNRGHDITIRKIPVSLKTQADSNIRRDLLHISKFMELGKGAWELPKLRDAFLEHMQSYDRIFQFRCLQTGPITYKYELVEIPKALLLEAKGTLLKVSEDSRQTPKPGYGRVYDAKGGLKFALYFDGGTERKLQIKSIRKDLCIVHGTWEFDSTPLEQAVSS